MSTGGTTRRRLLTAGAVAVGSTLLTAPEAFADGYGSGALGPWENSSKAISTLTQIRPVLDTDGLFMFGDSISVQDGYSLAQRLHSRTGDVIAVHNWSGRPTAPAVDALAQWAQTYGLPGRVLMATGSNDIFTPPVFAAQVERVMDIVGPARKVYWVNVQVARTSQTAAGSLPDSALMCAQASQPHVHRSSMPAAHELLVEDPALVVLEQGVPLPGHRAQLPVVGHGRLLACGGL